MKFDDAFQALLGHEGGFVDHPSDPGGATNFGITQDVARAHGFAGDMRALPPATAKAIYRSQYWDAVRADDLPAAVRYLVFDAAVNSGAGQAIRWLQRALGVADDGQLGPVTLAHAAAADPLALKCKLLAQRLRFMSGLKNWPSFSRGWASRIADLLED